MSALPSSADALPPRRNRLQRSLDRLGAEIDLRRSGQRAEIEELCAWLAARTFRGREEAAGAPGWERMAALVERERDPAARRDWCAMLLAVLRAAGVELLHPGWRGSKRENLATLRAMFLRRADWRRGPDEWRPHGLADHADALAGLARCLFVKWEMPVFMDQAWTAPGARLRMKRDLYAHIAAGRSLRSARLPYQLTRRQAHEFVQTPEHVSIEGALAWADVLSEGGEAKLAHAILQSELGAGLLMAPHRRAYWLSVVRYFAEHETFAIRHGAEIVDYLRARMDGGCEHGLRLHGRAPFALLGEVRDWHRELASSALTPNAARAPFPAADVKPFSVGGAAVGVDEPDLTFRIAPIRNALELREEGAAMSNCVFSYRAACSNGKTRIFSLKRARSDGVAERIATIRVQRGAVVEVKRRANYPAQKLDWDAIRLWCAREGLRPSGMAR